MTKAKRHLHRWPMVVAVLALAMQTATAGNPPVLSGSYQIVSAKDSGNRTQVRVSLHLANHGPSALNVRRITIWDFARPTASQSCALTIKAHGTVVTEQEFILKHSEYEMWRRGMRPRIVLEMPNAGNLARGATGKAALRLAPAAVEEVK